MSKHAVKLMTVGALVLLAGVASARGVVETPPPSDFRFGPPPKPFEPAPLAAPEIDPASLVSAASLLLGGLLVLRGRKA